MHCHIYQANHVIKHTEFFSVEILLFWLPGRKWQGLGPALSIAGAATEVASWLWGMDVPASVIVLVPCRQRLYH